MSTNFQPIFDYLDDIKSELRRDIKDDVILEIGSKLDKIQNTIDSITINYKKLDRNLIVEQYRTEQLEKWALPAGQKIGIKFKN